MPDLASRTLLPENQRVKHTACGWLRRPADSWRIARVIAHEGGEDLSPVRGSAGGGRGRRKTAREAECEAQG
jgi:hypothetical protein